MKALVTGCAGFIASHLTESLLADGFEVLGIDCFNDNYGRDRKLRNLRAARDWDCFEFVPLDLSRGALREIVEECDLVYHLAAEPGVRASWGSRFANYVANNILATQHLLEAMRESPGRPLVYASSSSIYGQADVFPTSEAALPRPVSPYGTTKLTAEHLCMAYHASFGLPLVALRFFSVYGPRQRPDMAFDSFCRAALGGRSITVFGDGSQTRDFTYVDDVVSAVRAAAEHHGDVTGRVYNIGGGSRVSLGRALETLGELTGAPLEIMHERVQAGDVRDTGADISRARAELGFSPQVTLEDGLAAQLEWVREDLALTAGRR